MKVGDLVCSISNLVRVGIIIYPWSHHGAIVQWNDGEYDFSCFADMKVIHESR